MGSTRFSKNPDPRLSPVNTRPARGARVLGMWSAAATAATYIVFDLGVILDPMLSSPWDVWVPIGASALIAPSFVLLTVSIHYSCSTAAKVWTHSSTLFAAIYAALAEIVYVTWLFVVHPRVRRPGGSDGWPSPMVLLQSWSSFPTSRMTWCSAHLPASWSRRMRSAFSCGSAKRRSGAGQLPVRRPAERSRVGWPDLCEQKVSGKVISRAEGHGAGQKP